MAALAGLVDGRDANVMLLKRSLPAGRRICFLNDFSAFWPLKAMILILGYRLINPVISLGTSDEATML